MERRPIIALRRPAPPAGNAEEERATQRRSGIDTLTSACFWALVTLYAVTFTAIALRRYDAFMMHALDMGNMEQAIWNTFHGHPFRFTNMRSHIAVEAFGTDTRLSFHVEPILLPLSCLQLIFAGPQALLILQTLVLASGAIPARQLARRYLAPSHLAEVALPLAYLLFPAMQAANLYEFHPVTLTAAILLWAFDFADRRLPAPFMVAGLAAVSCKEEIGLVVALMAVWSIRRGMPRRTAILFALFCALWSLIAVLAIIPAAEHAEHSVSASSPYLTRYVDPGSLTPGQYVQASPLDVVRYWLQHPADLANTVFGAQKRGFLERLLAPVGYLSLLSPLVILTSAPSVLLVLLSNDPHMFSGIGHYSAELVSAQIVAAVLGLACLVRVLTRWHISRQRVIACGCLLLCTLGLANSHANGFSPLSTNFEWPALTQHDRLAERMLEMIPPAASVSAQDTLDPHVSDRAAIYLFPDYANADYVALDVSASAIPSKPSALHDTVVAMLQSRQWDMLFADDGLLLLHRRPQRSEAVPVLPAQFYSFALPTNTSFAHPLQTMIAPGLELLGYTLTRKEVVNLRTPDVVITTYWRATARLTHTLTILTGLTDVTGQLSGLNGEETALPWLPTTNWKVGQIVVTSSTSIGIDSSDPGTVSACVSVFPRLSFGFSGRQGLPMSVTGPAAASGQHHLTSGARVVCFGIIPVIF